MINFEPLRIWVYALLHYFTAPRHAGQAVLVSGLALELSKREQSGLAFGPRNREHSFPIREPFGRRIFQTIIHLKRVDCTYLPLGLLAVAMDSSNAWKNYAALAAHFPGLRCVPVHRFGIERIRPLVGFPRFFAAPVFAIGVVLGIQELK